MSDSAKAVRECIRKFEAAADNCDVNRMHMATTSGKAMQNMAADIYRQVAADLTQALDEVEQ